MHPAVLEPPFHLDEVPDIPAIYVIHAGGARPLLGRTARLRRRLNRILAQPSAPSRFLNLHLLASRVEYTLTSSRLAAHLAFYEAARAHFPEDYSRLIRLRLPPYVRLLLANPYPRTQVTSRLSASQSLHFGPFRTRAAAERFEAEMLDLFQVRRCQEDLDVSPDHPGCIYGEMGRCLRPCQEVVSAAEYQSEVLRLENFLRSSGHTLLASVRAARERSAASLDFEEAHRQHLQVQRIEQVLKLRDDLVTDAARLSGVAVTPGAVPGHVELRFMLDGGWLPAISFKVAPDSTGAMIPMDQRLRALAETLSAARPATRERTEHLALLARWYYSSWRDGEWLPFDSLAALPYRRLVRAISRIASGIQATLF
ncbi:MAG: hypothetical protein KJZ84_12730 [Bryobacteraceae bacterium]|nr:hypothetical protein [Bryobacteraceae bacterium]